MADSYKKQIRDAAVSILTTALGSSVTVYRHRVRPIPQEDLPAVNVMVSAERSDEGAMGAVGVVASLVLDIVVGASDHASTVAADLADDIERQAIAALEASGLGIGEASVEWDNSEALETDDEAEVPLAVLETTFAVRLRVAQGDVTSII